MCSIESILKATEAFLFCQTVMRLLVLSPGLHLNAVELLFPVPHFKKLTRVPGFFLCSGILMRRRPFERAS